SAFSTPPSTSSTAPAATTTPSAATRARTTPCSRTCGRRTERRHHGQKLARPRVGGGIRERLRSDRAIAQPRRSCGAIHHPCAAGVLQLPRHGRKFPLTQLPAVGGTARGLPRGAAQAFPLPRPRRSRRFRLHV